LLRSLAKQTHSDYELEKYRALFKVYEQEKIIVIAKIDTRKKNLPVTTIRERLDLKLLNSIHNSVQDINC